MSSFIVRDTLGPAAGLSNQRLALWRRFKAAWPHDAATYGPYLVYYHNGALIDTHDFRRFINIIGVKYADLEEQDYEEIEYAYFKLTPPPLVGREFTTLEMFDAMGTLAIKKDDVCEVIFRYGGALNIIPDDSYTVVNTVKHPDTTIEYVEENAMTPQQIQDEVMSDPGMYVVSNKPIQVSGTRNQYMYSEDGEYDRREAFGPSSGIPKPKTQTNMYTVPAVQIKSQLRYGWYGLFDDNFDNFMIDNITPPIEVKYKEGYGYEWKVTYIATKDILDTDPCMVDFHGVFNENIDLPKTNGSVPFLVTDEDFRNEFELDDPEMWPAGMLSVPNSDAMKRSEFCEVISMCLTTDYSPMPASKEEKIFALVVVIIAIVVTIFSMGSLAGLAWPAALAAISFAFAMGAVVLGVGAALLGYFGGASAMKLVKMIGNASQFVGLIATVLGIMSFVGKFVTRMSKQYIMQAATKEAAEQTAKAATKEAGQAAAEKVMKEAMQLADQNFINRAVNVAFDGITSKLSLAGDSLGQVAEKLTTWADQSFTVYKYYDQNNGEMSNLEDSIVVKVDQLKELNEENAASKIDIFGQDIYTYSLGSIDQISEVNIKMDKQCGGWYAEQDPCASIT